MRRIRGNISLIPNKKNITTIITNENVKKARNISCKELFDNNICKWLEEFRKREFRCKGKNKQPISNPYYERPAWCPLLQRRLRDEQ